MSNQQVRLLSLQRELQERWFIFEEYYDLYYLTGLKLSKGVLMVGSKIVLFVDGKYEEAAKKTGLCEVISLERLPWWLKHEKVEHVEFDPSTTTYERYLFLHAHVPLKPAVNPVKDMRRVKSMSEIQAIESSAQLLMKGFSYICTLLKEGVQEKQLAKMFEIFCLEAGADRLAFEPIIAFGAHSAMPHYRAGEGVLKKGDCVLIDIGVVVHDYASDMTRTLFFGKVHPELEKIAALVDITYAEVAGHARPGVSAQHLDRVTRECIQAQGKYPILHSVGHGIGLEVHESPSLSIHATQDVLLQQNMVVTIEPGVYLPGIGGVRHENMVLIEKTGARDFYQALQVDRIII